MILPHLVELRDVHRTYRRGEETVRALRGVSLAVDAGDFLVVTGPSGSGKSTLLHIMAGLDRPSSGDVLLDGLGPDEIRTRAGQALERVGLGQRANHRPREMSGGEQQRVAIARALVIRPSLILADEPTGNLDSASGADILQILRDAPAEYGAAVVLVTHQPDAALPGERMLSMRDGLIEAATVAG